MAACAAMLSAYTAAETASSSDCPAYIDSSRLIFQDNLVIVAVAVEMARHDPAIRPDVANLDVIPLPNALRKKKRPRQIVGAVASWTVEIEGLHGPAVHRLAVGAEGPGRENPLAMSCIVERPEGAVIDVERILAARYPPSR